MLYRCVKFTHLNRFLNVCHVVLAARDKEICNLGVCLNILSPAAYVGKQQSIPVHNAVSRQTLWGANAGKLGDSGGRQGGREGHRGLREVVLEQGPPRMG